MDGFWSFLSTVTVSIAVIYIIHSFKRQIDSILTGSHVNLKFFGQEISVQRATERIGESVAELQAKIAELQSTEVNNITTGSVSDSPPASPTTRKKRILWVDDYPSNNAFIVNNLKGRNFDVDISIDTEDALNRFESLDYSMIVTDLGRKERGINNPLAGFELIKKVRNINANIPILVFAGSRGVEMRDDLISAGATDVTSSGIEVMKFINTHMPK
ncbi:response regulator [Aurantimonas sp. HBX-1]|uniref:response regulator n=1 Tax=Aurantimonas sp. HBX-1 TaxID=2906072 RepID=UPI001F1CCCF3|nr:response regulator [Aurantimonas sp. HBX-1]UIJ71285.1 response regulator [Aurantimonas sp. HBX-1]